MEEKQTLGEKFLASSAINAYSFWVIIVLFPLVLAGVLSFIDKSRNPDSLFLASIAIGIVSISYIIRFYMVRNTTTLRLQILEARNREQVIYIILGGFWWWLITLVCSIAATLAFI